MSNLDSRDTGIGAPANPPVPAVALNGITKRFGNVVACESVDLELWPGQIHALLGENGAGKSTLMKILFGLVQPERGTIKIDGHRVQILDPAKAALLGIGMVHQHFSLVDALTVWENVTLGETGRLDANATRARIAGIAERYGLEIDPDLRVGELSVGLRQRVEIIKCLRRDPHIIILDEPTAILSPEESEQLFSALRQMIVTENRTVVLVSHKLDEVLRASDEITVMRQGKVVDRFSSATADTPSLARAMVGRDVEMPSGGGALRIRIPDKESAKNSDNLTSSSSPTGSVSSENSPVLCIKDALASGTANAPSLNGFSLKLYSHEIVGVAGAEGNGQTALVDLLSSLLTLVSGTVTVNDTVIPTGKAGAMAQAGIHVIPEDRQGSGLVTDMTVAENLMLNNPLGVTKWGVINRKQRSSLAQQIIAKYNIVCSGPNALLWTISGGNQQRVVLARELASQPKILVAAHPLSGLDISAAEYIKNHLIDAASNGAAVLFISSALEEIFDISQRIAVIHSGRIITETPREETNLESLGLLMGGSPT
ncbi:MAG: ABC transporter ATP-binding protein [Acidimicrobiaceae bacterium]|nr:ABC transporter ATP-binding protein [Acidimicrobiaceae bacterium]